MTEEMKPIGLEQSMPFSCTAANACYNDCCRDLNQALTPYDILRLKNHLKISSQEFLKTYTAMHFGPESGLPVVEFKPNPDTGHACPFVTRQGCSVYPDRPASCRMYPLARAIARSRETGEITQYFALIEEPHCKGFGKETRLTVRHWLLGQDVERHNRENDKLLELISLKNRILPGKLEGALADKFYLALYNMDAFRDQIVDQDLFKHFPISADMLEKIKTDDEALLTVGLAWIKFMLFGINPQSGDTHS